MRQSTEVGKRRKASLRLTKRDLLLLADLYRFQILLSEHIHALHFPAVSPRRRNQRLQQLRAADLIAALPLPFGALTEAALGGFTPEGMGPRAYRIRPGAAEAISAVTGQDVEAVRKRIRSGPSGYTVHALEVAGVVVCFRQRACPRGWRLGEERVEFEARDSYEWRDRSAGQDGWRTDIVKPDLYLRFESGKETRDVFLEMDLGHTSADEWAKRLAVLRRYQETGAFFRRYEGRASFTVLTLTTGETRRAHLLQLMAREQRPGVRFFTGRLATFADTPNAPLWHGADVQNPTTLAAILQEGARP